jgi:hypothetical protein
MGFRFYRRFEVIPGVTLNLSKGGASISLGERGAHITVGTKGARETVGLPGTGLYYTQRQNWRGRRGQGQPITAEWWPQFFGWLAAYFAAFAVAIGLLEWWLG